MLVDIALRPANKSGRRWTSLDVLETLSRFRDRDPAAHQKNWLFVLVEHNGRDNNDELVVCL